MPADIKTAATTKIAAKTTTKTTTGTIAKNVSKATTALNTLTGGYKAAPTPTNATGMFGGTGITGTDRNFVQEMEASKLGYSAEYIASRGGINSQGYWNDVPLSGQLTAAEQKSVTLPNGTVNTQAMADILQKKQIAEKVAQGMSVADATTAVTSQYGKFALSSTGAGGFDANGNPTPGGQYGSGGAGSSNLSNAGDVALNNILKNYGLEDMSATIAKIRADYPEASQEQVLALAKTDSRYNKAYLTRFAGNDALIKKGLPTIDDATYLKVEKEYEKILQSYNLNSLATRAQYAEFIGNSMDAVDVTKRVQLGYDRLKSDKATLDKFKAYYPELSDGDIVAAMLKPDVMLPVLERKVTVAEISGAAALQGLASSQARSEELMGIGVNESIATAGFQQVAKKLPTGKFLSEISPETGIKYTQTTAEDIAFKKSVEAQRQEDILTGTEIGRFGGASGRLASKSRTSGLI